MRRVWVSWQVGAGQGQRDTGQGATDAEPGISTSCLGRFLAPCRDTILPGHRQGLVCLGSNWTRLRTCPGAAGLLQGSFTPAL